MSSLPTSGRVIIDTTVGPIEIELWAKETPKASRNFYTLAMEGYYDGVIFHRVVPGFLVQTGDRTGTGAGGESFYGEPFEDEIHPRLRFPHRGIVAMANAGTKHTNDSQFFITLDRADELHGKHTVFGRVVGDTIYNVMKIGQLELGEGERPVYPPKIKSIRILENPFSDIVPRITAAEKRAQQLAREQAQRDHEERERRKGGKKNVKLLSFGGDEGAESEEAPVAPRKKALNRPDLIDSADALPVSLANAPAVPKQKSTTPSAASSSTRKEPSGKAAAAVDLSSIRVKHAEEQSAESKARKAEIERMEADIRKLARRREGSVSDDERPSKKAKGPSQLEQELSRYAKNRVVVRRDREGKKRAKDEGDVLAAMESFRGKLQRAGPEDSPPPEEVKHVDPISAEAILPPPEEEGVEVDDDLGWLGHRLSFPKGNDEEVTKADRDYEVIDPRVRGERARQEERDRKKASARKQDRAMGQAFRRR
ncbi:cyclophilin-like protein [Exidia glandulosa HHB12029]|uniref:Cyclophilin-like protein n=1 Tax=Exidia glandulosa HHB12029 TaxID=1314781 RepID=A0A165M4P4_EXIGL|nr:cyclophilin-like protein [Exidia glandulosa HHB12029]